MPRQKNKTDLRNAISECYSKLVMKNGIDNVRVLDIVRMLGINKNSFYYHFSTKQNVAQWIFRQDVANMLQREFEGDELVFLPTDSCSITDQDTSINLFYELPYYVRRMSGVRMLDHGSFFKYLVIELQKRTDYYRIELLDSKPEGLRAYIGNLYENALREDIRIIAGGRYIPEHTLQFLTLLYTNMFVGTLIDLVCDSQFDNALLDCADNPFWNFGSESINQSIRSHPIGTDDQTLFHL